MGWFHNDFRNKYPFTDFHELNLSWFLDEFIELKEEIKNFYIDFSKKIVEEVNKWLNEHPEATTTVEDGAITNVKIADGTIELDKFSTNALAYVKNDYYTPQMFGAVGDGVTDDTEAFKTLSTSVETDSIVIIPKGDYLLTENVFCNVSVKHDEGTFIDKHFITRKETDIMFSQSNLMNAKVIDIASGYSIQGFCYNKNAGVYYVGVTDDATDNTQIIYTLDSSLNIISSITFNEPSLHLNTITYVPKTNQLLTIRSSGHDVLELHLSNGTTELVTTLNDFNSGIQYDEVLDVFVGVNGPAVSGIVDWDYRVYDTNWQIIKTGTFRNPYGFTNYETPNGFSVYNGLMVNSSFTTHGVQYGNANRIQFVFSVDFFGNVKKVYQEYVNQREFEGIAFNGRQYFTGAKVCDGKCIISIIDKDCIFADSVNNINQRVELPIVWDSTYVDSFHGHFNINVRERKIECSGYITLKTGLALDTEMTLGTIPDAFTPWGGNAVIPAAGGTGNINLIMVNDSLRCVLNSGAGRYVNIGGSYTY